MSGTRFELNEDGRPVAPRAGLGVMLSAMRG